MAKLPEQFEINSEIWNLTGISPSGVYTDRKNGKKYARFIIHVERDIPKGE